MITINAQKTDNSYRVLTDNLRAAIQNLDAAKWTHCLLRGQTCNYTLTGSDALVFPGQERGVIHAANLRQLCKVIEDDIVEIQQTPESIIILYNGHDGHWHFDSRATLNFTDWKQCPGAIVKRIEFCTREEVRQ